MCRTQVNSTSGRCARHPVQPAVHIGAVRPGDPLLASLRGVRVPGPRRSVRPPARPVLHPPVSDELLLGAPRALLLCQVRHHIGFIIY